MVIFGACRTNPNIEEQPKIRFRCRAGFCLAYLEEATDLEEIAIRSTIHTLKRVHPDEVIPELRF